MLLTVIAILDGKILQPMARVSTFFIYSWVWMIFHGGGSIIVRGGAQSIPKYYF